MTDHKPWTSRVVVFEVFPREDPEKLDHFLDALVDHYWERAGFVRVRLLRRFPGIGRHGREVNVSFQRGPIPRWWLMREVCNVARREGVGGVATVRIERCVL